MQIPVPFEQAMIRKYPEAISLVIVRDRKGKFNPIPLGWVTMVSREPPMVAISVGLTRYSLEEIRHRREFVLAFPPSTMGKEILYYGTTSGRDVDKLAETPIRTQPATQIDGVILSDAVANFECLVVSELTTGDHVLFVADVVASHANEDESVRRLYAIARGESGGVVPG
jgi:flavin reductase (DIM6/NTAB) family NADH-FMN oxidoreductase RutF